MPNPYIGITGYNNGLDAALQNLEHVLDTRGGGNPAVVAFAQDLAVSISGLYRNPRKRRWGKRPKDFVEGGNDAASKG